MNTELDPETAAHVDRYWADTLGCMPGEMRESGVTITAFPPDGPEGIAIFDKGDSRVVAAASEGLEDLEDRRSAIREWSPEDGHLAVTLGRPNATVLGPQRITYATADTFRPVHDANTRPLGRSAKDEVDALRKRCGEEWTVRADDIGFESHETITGRFLGDKIAAVAAYREVGSDIARIAGIADAEHRNRGFGTAAISAAVTEALADGYIAECRPLEAWDTAIDIGEFLGFISYGTAWRIVDVEG